MFSGFLLFMHNFSLQISEEPIIFVRQNILMLNFIGLEFFNIKFIFYNFQEVLL